jgi:26S proteasome regulatory subunit N3
MPDVEMAKATDKKEDKKDEKKDDKKPEPKPEPPTPTQEIKANIALIDRAINDLETRFTHRVLRSLTALRKRINDKVLRDAIEENYPRGV